ncbi:hypothetical protein K1Y78_58625, partial [Streptomyces sp. tea 10]|nr:hypothetical protein [Streptomyces sp. tea 10]
MYFYAVTYHAIRASNLIAKERGESFVGFEKSAYASGTFFDKYVDGVWEPLFDGALVPDTACVVAMGSHEPQFRELDSALMGRAQVVVEDRATAMREAGDVIQAVADSSLHEDSLVGLADVVTGAVAPDETRPRVFKCVGMSWQDLAVAVGVVDPNA